MYKLQVHALIMVEYVDTLLLNLMSASIIYNVKSRDDANYHQINRK
eukprot:UN06538